MKYFSKIIISSAPIFFILFIISFIFILSITNCLAVNYYVAPNGEDTNNGLSYSTPYKTFQRAVNQANPGDTIYALGGIYDISNTATETCSGTRTAFAIICYNAKSGNSTHRITIRNYPGENPILNASNSAIGHAIIINRRSYWTIQGLEIIGKEIQMMDGTTPANANHDIIIRDNKIHDVFMPNNGDNYGLIFINRGDSTGDPYNIFIWNNTLYNLYIGGEIMSPNYNKAAITLMSICSYDINNPSLPCTGYVEIENNTIYNVGHAFHFKNAMYGPIKVYNNNIHTAIRLGISRASNVRLIKNMIYNLNGGFRMIGTDDIQDTDYHFNATGQNYVIENNTMVGIEGMLEEMYNGKNHIIKNNIFFGLTTPRGGSRAYIDKSHLYPDSPNPLNSTLQTITSNNNCFITPTTNFQFVLRRVTPIEYYNYDEAKNMFGFDTNSVIIIESNASKIFVDPTNNDYHLIDTGMCPGMGYYGDEGQAISCILPFDFEPCNCINNTELFNTINAWNFGQITIQQLITNIKTWKQCSN
ncbi:MAG: hypothetical protein QXG00_01755 [Candidatus Woesearchaeota archaeon]